MTPYFEDQPEPGSLVLDAFAAPTNGTSSFSDKVNYLILVFKNMSPYHFGAFGLACCIGPSVLGAAWGIFMIAPSLFGAAVRVPRIWSLNLISIIFCEAVALYGVIITIILIQKQKDIPLMSDGSLCPFTRYVLLLVRKMPPESHLNQRTRHLALSIVGGRRLMRPYTRVAVLGHVLVFCASGTCVPALSLGFVYVCVSTAAISTGLPASQ